MSNKRQGVDIVAETISIGGEALVQLVREGLVLPERPVMMATLKIRLPQARHGEWLLVVNGQAEDGTPMVAFMSGDSLAKALRRLMVQYEDGSLKWKIDQWRIDNAS